MDGPRSDLDLRCLLQRLQNVSVDNKNVRLFEICALMVNTKCTCEVSDIRTGLL